MNSFRGQSQAVTKTPSTSLQILLAESLSLSCLGLDVSNRSQNRPRLEADSEQMLYTRKSHIPLTLAGFLVYSEEITRENRPRTCTIGFTILLGLTKLLLHFELINYYYYLVGLTELLGLNTLALPTAISRTDHKSNRP